MPKPEPVSKTVVCSMCALPWDDHKKPSLEECVRLLRAELVKRSRVTYTMANQSVGNVWPINTPFTATIAPPPADPYRPKASNE